MKIAIIARRTSANTKDLTRACADASIECVVYEAKEISIDTKAFSSSDFFSHDVYVFRGYNRSYTQAQALAQYLHAHGKIIIDAALATNFIPSKLHEALVYERHGIAHPRTFFFRQAEEIDTMTVPFPLVVKDVDSQRGRGVRLCRSKDELAEEIQRHGESIIVQEFVKMDYDLRVLCVGRRVLGAVKRHVVEGDFRSNVSLGATVEPYEVTEQVRELALKAHRALGYDIAGVDIGIDTDGTPFVIETNITPEWQGFQAAVGVDVARGIIQYAKERFDDARS